MNKRIFMSLAMALTLVATSCKKDKDKDNDNEVLAGNVNIEFEHVINEVPISLNENYILGSDTISFSTFKYYVSNVQFITSDGSVWSEPNSYHLIDLSNENSALLNIADVPKGDYTGMRLMIGVDSTRNVSGAQDGALSVANSMFWSWNSGYIFIKMEGLHSSAMDGAFTYHIGGFSGPNNAIRERVLDFGSAVMMVSSDATPQVHLALDAGELFTNGINVSGNSMIHMPGAAASSFADQFSGVLSFEHLHN
jgi:hypothetical protein